MPAKKPMSDEDKDLVVRQEGRRGFLKLRKDKIAEFGERRLEDVFDKIRFQIFARHSDAEHTIFYGYCSLFAPLSLHEKSPYYKMRVDFKEPDPVIEMFIVEE